VETIANSQGVYSERVEHQNHFRRTMADIVIGLNPLAQNATIVFNKIEKDHYDDSRAIEEGRMEKRILLSKKADLFFVQDLFGDLIEDESKIPWLVQMTLTGLPRLVNNGDNIIVEDVAYTVAKVAPVHRLNDGILRLLIYVERGVKPTI